MTRAAYPAADKFFRMMEFRTLIPRLKAVAGDFQPQPDGQLGLFGMIEIGRASCRERV